MIELHNQAITAKLRGDLQRGRGEGKTYTKLYGRHEHRVVMEQKLGRELLPGEIVHHIDHNKKNNHPDNLMVMTQSEHARLHSTKNRKCEVDGCDNKHRSLGLCNSHYRKMRYKTIYKPRRNHAQANYV